MREGFRLSEDRDMAVLLSQIIFNAGLIKRFHIFAYQIMPDYIHMLVWENHVNNIGMASAGGDTRTRRRMLSPHQAQISVSALAFDTNQPTISDFIYTIKSFFIYQLRRKFGIEYPIWQRRFYVRIVNTDKYLHSVIQYIHYNPIKADLPLRFQHCPYQYICNHNSCNFF